MWETIEDEILPNALMMGVDYELFWSLDPKSLSPFVKAFSMKKEQEDAMMWQHGLYVRMAVLSSLDKNVKYPKKPMMAEQMAEKRETPEQRQKRLKEKFLAHVTLINAKIKKGE